MRLQYASDLHLEIPANRDFVLAGALEPAAEYLLLAGDISLLSDWHKADATGTKLMHSGIGALGAFSTRGLCPATTTTTPIDRICLALRRFRFLCGRT